MGKAEFGTPKYFSNQMKARGLQKLKFYCQICEKQCRDDNGFKSHTRSESHLKRIKQVDSSVIDDFSKQFQSQFLANLRSHHGDKSINANRFYNQLIQQKDHIHLNSTKWSSLSQFLQDIGKQGLINVNVVDESDQSLNGVDISYVNNSSDEITRQNNLKKHSEDEKAEEHLSMKLLKDQIKKGEELRSKEEEEDNPEDKHFTRSKDDAPIKISIGAKKDQPATNIPKRTNAFKVSKPKQGANPLKKNVLK
ncbi:DNA/RNA-binding protein [Wickerhamomyces ciferrii]|uniref:DNA/RNA-binding protein n=1 Tax=Wickerhamomyces ciferrii (strain ATCC 14091 / BCRC 22168 / CBS 111 / JCM 3599 / NBRC 0793 / NRRL Y-1031 F-60-10) TaxID=1206466 RepID=K0KD30_WICCF|nr:DNA/RNA-binding protein [Wickerhamomyces ciferrii]CCH43010.1 DNA/RNA-binding protein [Wickerhamomyces ciferrii]